MSQFLFYLPLPPFLAQWYIHKNGGVVPVKINRNSSENGVLRHFLSTPPEDYVPSVPPAGQLAVEIPSYPAKDPRTYNYVPPYGVNAIVEILREDFDLQLHEFYVGVYLRGGRLDCLLEAWMLHHGIEFNDANFNSVKKRLDRMRNAIKCHRYRSKKKSKK